MICTPHIYYSGNENKKNEMVRACGRYGRQGGACRALVGRPEGKRPLGRTGIHGRILLKLIFKKWNGRHGLD
jgi:hypothetical protein